MDLYSGIPYWIAKDQLCDYFNPLNGDISADVLVIGSGITGALVANELIAAGIDCTMVDKRGMSNGSSVASTALLQYEIDTPLCKLAEMMYETDAVEAYRASLQAVADVGKALEGAGVDADYSKAPSLYYASNDKGLELIKKEYAIRKKHGIPVTYMDEKEVRNKYGIKAPGALENDVSARMDPYRGAMGLNRHNMSNGNLKFYTHTRVRKIADKKTHCVVTTDKGYKIKCHYVVVAAGFEAGDLMPEKVMKLTSSYAIISEPVDPRLLWKDQALIWETREPYLYIRTNGGNRIIVGGEDEPFREPVLRDALLRKKVRVLERKFGKLFPDIPFKTDMAWCGTFSVTDDGLPYIGSLPGHTRVLYALGYGGNGITFSMIAAQVITNKLIGKPDTREPVFGFTRFSGGK